MLQREKTRLIKVDNVQIGHQNKVVIQSMTTTKTHDIKATLNQIIALANEGCELVRVAVLDDNDIKENSKGTICEDKFNGTNKPEEEVKTIISDKDEYDEILKDVRRHPKRYLAQKKFISAPIKGVNDELYHVCLGSYTIDCKHAGFYARISSKNRIDSDAKDIPVIIERSE